MQHFLVIVSDEFLPDVSDAREDDERTSRGIPAAGEQNDVRIYEIHHVQGSGERTDDGQIQSLQTCRMRERRSAGMSPRACGIAQDGSTGFTEGRKIKNFR